jgi:hypothetical protein
MVTLGHTVKDTRVLTIHIQVKSSFKVLLGFFRLVVMKL